MAAVGFGIEQLHIADITFGKATFEVAEVKFPQADKFFWVAHDPHGQGGMYDFDWVAVDHVRGYETK
jgi:hypothetical protein